MLRVGTCSRGVKRRLTLNGTDKGQNSNLKHDPMNTTHIHKITQYYLKLGNRHFQVLTKGTPLNIQKVTSKQHYLGHPSITFFGINVSGSEALNLKMLITCVPRSQAKELLQGSRVGVNSVETERASFGCSFCPHFAATVKFSRQQLSLLVFFVNPLYNSR